MLLMQSSRIQIILLGSVLILYYIYIYIYVYIYLYIYIYIYHKNLNSVRLSKVLIFDEKMKENANVYACFEKEAFKNRKSFFMKNL